jgi:hypothetical protein
MVRGDSILLRLPSHTRAPLVPVVMTQHNAIGLLGETREFVSKGQSMLISSKGSPYGGVFGIHASDALQHYYEKKEPPWNDDKRWRGRRFFRDGI